MGKINIILLLYTTNRKEHTTLEHTTLLHNHILFALYMQERGRIYKNRNLKNVCIVYASLQQTTTIGARETILTTYCTGKPLKEKHTREAILNTYCTGNPLKDNNKGYSAMRAPTTKPEKPQNLIGRFSRFV